jgi:hypothetical protein
MIQEIWNKLSSVDVGKHTETKGKFTYLPWNYAVDYIMKNTPDLESFDFDFLHYTDSNGMVRDYIVAPDESCSVECVVDINGIKRKMWLAVTDFNNKPIKNPSCTDIANTKMRCLTKCISTGYGLGFYIYKGEGVPQEEYYTEEQTAEFSKLIGHECFEGKKKAVKDELRKSTSKPHYKKVLNMMKQRIEEFENKKAEEINQDLDSQLEGKL